MMLREIDQHSIAQIATMLPACPIKDVHFLPPERAIAKHPVPIFRSRAMLRTVAGIVKARKPDTLAFGAYAPSADVFKCAYGSASKPKVFWLDEGTSTFNHIPNIAKVFKCAERLSVAAKLRRVALRHVIGTEFTSPTTFHFFTAFPDFVKTYFPETTLDNSYSYLKSSAAKNVQHLESEFYFLGMPSEHILKADRYLQILATKVKPHLPNVNLWYLPHRHESDATASKAAQVLDCRWRRLSIPFEWYTMKGETRIGGIAALASTALLLATHFLPEDVPILCFPLAEDDFLDAGCYQKFQTSYQEYRKNPRVHLVTGFPPRK